MNWKKSLCALGVGAAIGYTIKTHLTQLPIRPEQALKLAKQMFKEKGAVSGSWIYMKPEKIELHDLEYTIYRGGITRTINEVNTQYEFFVDAYTGTIVATEETSPAV
ncbi:PepSY domain-containing protein [Amphibacillus sediminis]|uniref:PepSY domain-containing protein n=1 Tax=Amphibacillus sediminis TaxID=360185 RepID=UPI0008314756|nr:PepSY domain-containing protein [Amphibacillus sediminis]